MPFNVNFKIFEPGKIAPCFQTSDRQLAYIEWNAMKARYGNGTLARLVPEVTYIEGSSSDKYVWLVYQVLKAIRKYYDERNSVPKEQSSENLKASLALEKQLDLRNADIRFHLQGHPNFTPSNKQSFDFFLVVEAWRNRWKEYFRYKKQADKDPKWEKKLRDDCFAMEGEIRNYVKSVIGI